MCFRCRRFPFVWVRKFLASDVSMVLCWLFVGLTLGGGVHFGRYVGLFELFVMSEDRSWCDRVFLL